MTLTPLKTELINGWMVGLFNNNAIRVLVGMPIKVGDDDYELQERWHLPKTRAQRNAVVASSFYRA